MKSPKTRRIFLLAALVPSLCIMWFLGGQSVTIFNPPVTSSEGKEQLFGRKGLREEEHQVRRNEYSADEVARSRPGARGDDNHQCLELAANRGRRTEIQLQQTSMTQVEKENKDVLLGGIWSPETCTSYQSVAIIIPYRDRGDHLTTFLRHIHPFLQAQMLTYSILVVEQAHPDVFNRGALLNIGFLEARKLWPRIDCFIFHDVDLLPEDFRNLYRCRERPLHLGAFVDTSNYSVHLSAVGGVLAVRPSHMFLTNGFSNTFWGWGGEDDDMHNRIVQHRQMKVVLPDPVIGRFTMIKHKRDKLNPRNPENKRGQKVHGTNYAEDGINSILYRTVNITASPLYTKVIVRISVDSKTKHHLSDLVKKAKKI